MFAQLQPALLPFSFLGFPLNVTREGRRAVRHIFPRKRDSQRRLLQHEGVEPRFLVPREEDVGEALIVANRAFCTKNGVSNIQKINQKAYHTQAQDSRRRIREVLRARTRLQRSTLHRSSIILQPQLIPRLPHARRFPARLRTPRVRRRPLKRPRPRTRTTCRLRRGFLER